MKRGYSRVKGKDDMFERLKSRTTVAVVTSVVAALGVGGIALAQGSSSSGSTTQVKSHPEALDEQGNAPDTSPNDTDNVQSGAQDEETNDQPGDDGASEHADQPAGHASKAEAEDPGTDQGEQ
jgi:hypothetical protein